MKSLLEKDTPNRLQARPNRNWEIWIDGVWWPIRGKDLCGNNVVRTVDIADLKWGKPFFVETVVFAGDKFTAVYGHPASEAELNGDI